MKRAADDIAELAKKLDAKSIVLGGHDWCIFSPWKLIPNELIGS
jgi:hypothetical protein